ncbi:MAG: ArsA-related P-loop ATPase [Candidatus Limnocylindrales bacterium]|nr:ArsA-related P-loop ATPase [Candidatus Limnocylindrales bacterium]
MGYRTIVLATDIAHSLADAFEIELEPEPAEIAPNLRAQEPTSTSTSVATGGRRGEPVLPI